MASFNNPPFEIIDVKRENGLKKYGTDSLTWKVKLKTDAYELEVGVDFDMMMKYCNFVHPEVGKYYSSVQTNIKGFGPKHSKMLAIMDEEGFDHLPHIHNFIKDSYNLEEWHQQALRNSENNADKAKAKELSDRFDALEAGLQALSGAAIRDTAFKDDLFDFLTKEVNTRFPEIFNSDPAHIMECKDILIREVMNIGDKINALAYKASKKKGNGGILG